MGASDEEREERWEQVKKYEERQVNQRAIYMHSVRVCVCVFVCVCVCVVDDSFLPKNGLPVHLNDSMMVRNISSPGIEGVAMSQQNGKYWVLQDSS